MPPCARQPATSYWPPTNAPGARRGSKSNAVRHLGQKPFVRPRCPSRALPTGAPHTEQKRLSSPTTGGSINAWRGSTTGTGGTRVSPAPRRDVDPPRSRRRVGLDPATTRAEPNGTEPSLLLPVTAEPGLSGALGADMAPLPLTPGGGSGAAFGAAVGAIPHTSQ